MARETDFLDLYRILGVQSDCELNEFKKAYRRRVLVLHPDRRSNGQNDQIASERLQRLTALYGAAMRFERQHGRLPGASTTRSAERPAAATGTVDPLPTEQTAAPTKRRPRWLLMSMVVVSLGWLWWSNQKPATPTDLATIHTVADPSPQKQAAVTAKTLPNRLELGMDGASVRALEGEPVMINGRRWEYGPSWIRFEDDHVVDWYSSQLQPLKASRSPEDASR